MGVTIQSGYDSDRRESRFLMTVLMPRDRLAGSLMRIALLPVLLSPTLPGEPRLRPSAPTCPSVSAKNYGFRMDGTDETALLNTFLSDAAVNETSEGRGVKSE